MGSVSDIENSGGSRRVRRRVTQKVASAIQQTLEVGRQARLENDVAWIVTHLRENPEQVANARIFLETGLQSDMPRDVFPRGVRRRGVLTAWPGCSSFSFLVWPSDFQISD